MSIEFTNGQLVDIGFTQYLWNTDTGIMRKEARIIDYSCLTND